MPKSILQRNMQIPKIALGIFFIIFIFVGCGRDQVTERFPDEKPKVIRTYGWFRSMTQENLIREQTFYQNGKTAVETHYKSGLRHGPYADFWQTGFRKTEGQFLLGKKAGDWKFYFNQYTVSAQGMFVADKKEGKWRQYFENGEPRAEGNFHEGKETGTYKEWTNKGEPTLENSCFEKNEHGRYRNFYVNKQVNEDYACRYGVPTGSYVKKDPDGVTIEMGSFDDKGRKEGEWETIYNGNTQNLIGLNRRASLKHYHQGFETDSSFAWYANGNIKERAFFQQGTGERLSYDTLGKLIERQQLAKGRPEGELWTYFATGAKHSLVTYKDGAPVEQQSWHLSGKVRSEGKFKMGKRLGVWNQYFENGKLSLVSPYQDGVLHGLQIFYDVSGKVTQTLRYEHGYPAEGKIPAVLAAGVASLKKKAVVDSNKR